MAQIRTPLLHYGLPVLIVLVVFAIYLPVFDAGFVNYDDPWLIQKNPYFAPEPKRAVWWAFFFDLSRDTRLALGAEYLPVRDVFGFFETRLFGITPEAMHVVSVGLYASAALLLRGALLATFGRGFAVEIAAFLFAVHPVHAESVAWLAGQKDVLALLFVCGALFVHARNARFARFSVPMLVLLATFSKSMSVVVVLLLCVQDFVRKRRPDAVLYGTVIVVITLSMAVHASVGQLVGMVAAPAGGSRYAALITMGPVWVRYFSACLLPTELSIVYDVPDATQWSVPAGLGYAFMLCYFALAFILFRRGACIVPASFVWFAGPLLPVSQVLVPLQNRMADRYLWLSVLGPCLLLAFGLAWCRDRARSPSTQQLVVAFGAALVVALSAVTVTRSIAFSDSVLLFADATRKTVHDTGAPYQLGKALEEKGRNEEAILAFREVIRRAGDIVSVDARRATNNLAGLLAKRGELLEAEALLRRALGSFPGDAKLTGNLAKVLRGMGRIADAEALERQNATPRAPGGVGEQP